MSESWHKYTGKRPVGLFTLQPWHWRAVIGDMRLYVHRPGCLGTPLSMSMTKWQYAIAIPDSDGRQDVRIVADCDYATDERDAKIRALRFAVHLFEKHRDRLRKRLGLVKIPPILVEMARVDVREAVEMLRETVRMPREDVVTVPAGVPHVFPSECVKTQPEPLPAPCDGLPPGPGVEHVPQPVAVRPDHAVV